MLTVKYVAQSGEEITEEFERVEKWFLPSADTSDEYAIHCFREGATPEPKNQNDPRASATFDEGSVYVMNRYGKTVAVYHMYKLPPGNSVTGGFGK